MFLSLLFLHAQGLFLWGPSCELMEGGEAKPLLCLRSLVTDTPGLGALFFLDRAQGASAAQASGPHCSLPSPLLSFPYPLIIFRLFWVFQLPNEMFINFIKSKLKLKAFFKAKYLIRQRMDKRSWLLIPSFNGWKRGRRWFLHSFIYSFAHSHACICSFGIVLGDVRHCPRRRNTKVKMVPTIGFTVCQGRQTCKQTTLASIPHRIVYELQRWHKHHTHL